MALEWSRLLPARVDKLHVRGAMCGYQPGRAILDRVERDITALSETGAIDKQSNRSPADHLRPHTRRFQSRSHHQPRSTRVHFSRT